MLTVYVLKNGVGRYNTLFFLREMLMFVSFSCRIRQYFCVCHTCAFPSANNFAYAQTLYRIGSLCRSRNIWILYGSTLSSLMDTRKSKKRRISFVLGYLRMIYWNISTAISIKQRILVTFYIKKNQFERLYAFKRIALYTYILGRGL